MRTILVLAAISSALGSGLRDTPLVRSSDNHARHVADAAVIIRTFQFAPDTLRANPGTRVMWSNTDEIEHTITSGTPESRDGRFSGVVTKRGATYSAVLERPGTYRYFCDRHRFMTGIVIINPRRDIDEAPHHAHCPLCFRREPRDRWSERRHVATRRHA